MTRTFTDQRLVSAQEMSRLAAGLAATYYWPSSAGGAVTPSSGMVIAVAAITTVLIYANGTVAANGYAGGTLAVATADTVNPRRDHVWHDPALGTIGITQGTAAASPVLPDITAARISIAEIYIAANDTSIDAADIVDMRTDHAAIVPRTAGFAATATAQMGYDTTATSLKVWDGSASQSLAVGTPAIPEVLLTLPWHSAVSVTSQTISANEAYLVPIWPPIPRAVTITKILWQVVVQNGNCDIGLYSYDGTTFTRLASLGSTACPASGQVASDIADTALTVGTRYFLAISFDGATASYKAESSPKGINMTGGAFKKASSFPLPLTIVSATALDNTGGLPLMAAIVTGGGVTA